MFELRHNRQTALLRVNSWEPRLWSFVSAAEHAPCRLFIRMGRGQHENFQRLPIELTGWGGLGGNTKNKYQKHNHQETPPRDHTSPDRSSYPLSNRIMYLRRHLRSFSSSCVKLEGDTILSPHLSSGHHTETSHPFFAFVKVNSTK